MSFEFGPKLNSITTRFSTRDPNNLLNKQGGYIAFVVFSRTAFMETPLWKRELSVVVASKYIVPLKKQMFAMIIWRCLTAVLFHPDHILLLVRLL